MLSKLFQSGAACAVVVFAGAAGLGSSADASMIYAADGALSNTGNLYQVDTTTGLATTVGALVDASGNAYSINGMAWDAGSGTLFGSTSSASPTLPNGLVTINPGNGQVSQIGALGLTPPNFAAGLDYSDGNLRGWAEGSLSALIDINAATGAANVVGPNAQGINTTGSGLATDSGGTTYITPDGSDGNLWQVNTATGALGSPIALSGGSTDGRIGALEFRGDTLFGTELVGDGVTGITSNQLISINTSTGAITAIGQFRDADTMDRLPNIDALAIPAPGVGAILALSGVVAFRRRR